MYIHHLDGLFMTFLPKMFTDNPVRTVQAVWNVLLGHKRYNSLLCMCMHQELPYYISLSFSAWTSSTWGTHAMLLEGLQSPSLLPKWRGCWEQQTVCLHSTDSADNHLFYFLIMVMYRTETAIIICWQSSLLLLSLWSCAEEEQVHHWIYSILHLVQDILWLLWNCYYWKCSRTLSPYLRLTQFPPHSRSSIEHHSTCFCGKD